MKLFAKLSILFFAVLLFACGENFDDDREASKLKFDEYIKEAGIAESYMLESGMYFIPRSEGSGVMPEAGDEVVIEYRVYTLDSTYIQDNEATAFKYAFTLYGTDINSQTIPYGMQGLHEGLELMKGGSVATMIIPNDLAFAHREVNNLPRFINYRLEVTLLSVNEQIFE